MISDDESSQNSTGINALGSMHETTTDSFLNNAFKTIQPKNGGYRSGMDALLLAAAIPDNASGTVADLGSGTGVAGLSALCLNPDIDLLAVERNETIANLASRSLHLPANAKLKSRVVLIVADVTANAATRAKAGLAAECVSHVIMNPPYNPNTMRPPNDKIRAEALMIGNNGIDAWFRTAASIIKPGGTLSVIYRTTQLGDLMACMSGRFGGLEILPLHSRKNDPAKRLIVRGKQGSRAPPSILPGLVIHNAAGDFTKEAAAIFAGKSKISALQSWD